MQRINIKNRKPKLVLIKTKSIYSSDIGLINEYSIDNINFKKFLYPVQLQGAKFSFVAKNLRNYNSFRLDDFTVVGGKNNGKPLSKHLEFKVNKCFCKIQ